MVAKVLVPEHEVVLPTVVEQGQHAELTKIYPVLHAVMMRVGIELTDPI